MFKSLGMWITAVYQAYPWLGTLSGKKRIIGYVTGGLAVAGQFVPALKTLSPWVEKAEPYFGAVSLFFLIWGWSHAVAKKVEVKSVP